MGFRFRKSINLGGGFRINLSKSGVGYSWGTKGYRITKTAKGSVRTTASIPGTGISYVEETSRKKPKSSVSVSHSNSNRDMPLELFAVSMAIGVLLALAGILVILKVSWWGIALFGAGLGVLTIVYKKV